MLSFLQTASPYPPFFSGHHPHHILTPLFSLIYCYYSGKEGVLDFVLIIRQPNGIHFYLSVKYRKQSDNNDQSVFFKIHYSETTSNITSIYPVLSNTSTPESIYPRCRRSNCSPFCAYRITKLPRDGQ